MSDVHRWLASHGLGQLADTFEREQIDVAAARSLTDADLKDLGLPMGVRSKLRVAIQALQNDQPDVSVSASDAAGTAARIPSTDFNSVPVQAERRQLTILFCDLVGSTRLAQKMDPEGLRELMHAYQNVCRTVIERYDGHVAQYLGDGLMVYLGWPRAHEDDAERAVRSALALVDAVKRVHADMPLQVRVGIATGPVVVGETGGGDAAQPKLAVGETPNLASRLQGLAQPDEIVIAPSTHRLLHGAFTYAAMGQQVLKGIVEPVHPYRVLGEGTAQGRFEAAHGASALTPMVGRESELTILRSCWRQVQSGEGQLVLLGGEPGIGKSRVTEAMRAMFQDHPHHLLRYQCSPYHTQSALRPVVEQIESSARFARDDSVEHKLDKLEVLLGAEGRDLSAVLPLYAGLLSLPTGRYPALNYAPQKQKEMMLDTLIQRIGELARAKPVLMVFEDVHWIDPTTQEALDLLVARIPRWPVLLLVTHRPEYVPRWSGEAHVTAITLNRLNRRLGSQLAEKVTGGKKLPAEVVDQVLAKTDGVPLFVEELVKNVMESGFLKDMGDRYELTGPLPHLAIPSTLHDSLMARLDRLATVKDLAQIGACIGRGFSYELLASVSSMSATQLDAALVQLVQSELVFQQGTIPTAHYTFKHALVQDAARESLLKTRRQALHRRIAECMEQRFPEMAAHSPEVVAQHYSEANVPDKAAEFWLRAGSRAVERFDNVEAVAHLNKGLEALQRVPAGAARDQTELLLQIHLGNALGTSKGYTPPEVGQAFSRARELCESVGNIPQMLSILVGLWIYYLMRADYRSSGEMGRQIMALAHKTGNTDDFVVAHDCMAWTAFFTADFGDAIAHGTAGWEMWDKNFDQRLPILYGFHMAINCQDVTGWALFVTGYPDQSAERYRVGIDLARRLRHPLTIAMMLVHQACVDCMAEDLDATLSRGSEVIAYSKENSILIRQIEGEILQGWVLAEKGDVERGIPQIAAGIAMWTALGAQIGNPVWYFCLAKANMKAGKLSDARNALRNAFEYNDNNGERFMESDLHRLDGDLCLLEGASHSQAEERYRNAIQSARRFNAKIFELRASTALAKLWDSQGRCLEARELLRPVYEWFTEGFATQDLIQARQLLDSLGKA